MIRTVNLTKVFRTDEVETTALNEVSFEIKQGEFVAIMGPSGCGKSTLARLVTMIETPTSGSLVIKGVDICACSKEDLHNLHKFQVLRHQYIHDTCQSLF